MKIVHLTWSLRLRAWVIACVDLPSTLISILTYCTWQPQWGFKLMIRWTKDDMIKEIARRKKEKERK